MSEFKNSIEDQSVNGAPRPARSSSDHRPTRFNGSVRDDPFPDEDNGSLEDWSAEDVTPNEASDDPHRLARAILAHYEHPEGSRLAYFRRDFYVWESGAFRVKSEFEETELVRLVKDEVDLQAYEAARLTCQSGRRAGSRPPTVTRVTSGLCRDVKRALASLADVRAGSDQEPPFWVKPRANDPDPKHAILVQNGVLVLDDDGPWLLAHTPRLFALGVVSYEYDSDAPAPRWLRFLHDQWADDPETVSCLHEQLGYLLTPDTRLQRIFLWIGPRRSGRSTIRDVMENLVGKEKVAATSPADLAGPFGLHPLLGKTVAVMGDARTGDTSVSAVALDRMLRISGCDLVDVNRKHASTLSGIRLGVRLVILSNEIPTFRDNSNAITSRYLIIRATQTIPEEARDPDLGPRLIEELPGILNLAIEGYYRLRKRRRFRQPASAADLLQVARDVASPTGRFVEEELVIDPTESVPKADLFQLWQEWAKANGQTPINAAIFGRNLKSACPSIKDGPRRRIEGVQAATYQGVGRKLSPSLTDPAPRWQAKDDDGLDPGAGEF